MNHEERTSIKVMVKQRTGFTHVQTSKVVRFMEIKNDIDNGNVAAALNGILAHLLREVDLVTIDDLTKLLNTGCEGFDTARILMNGLNKEGV